MSGFTGNYYWGVPNVNRSRIPVRTLGTIQEGGQPGGFNMYNTSTITQIPTSSQTTTPVVPTSTQPSNTQNTTITPPVSTTTQTSTPQVPVSNVTTLPNILNTTTTPVGTTTGATQGGSGTGNSGNSTGGFNFFNNLYGSTGGYNPPHSTGFGFNNIQNPPPGFGGGFGGGFGRGNPGGNPGGPPGGGGNLGGLDPNVAALVNALTGMNIGGGYASRKGSFVKPGEFGGTETEDPNEWLERFNRIAEANMWTEYRRF